MQSKNTSISTYRDNNNPYQALILTKTIIIPFIKSIRPSNKVQWSSGRYWGTIFSAINCNESKWNFVKYGDNEIGQHIIPTNIPVPQESKIDIIYVLGNYRIGSDMQNNEVR